jgi:hypothetical protein
MKYLYWSFFWRLLLLLGGHFEPYLMNNGKSSVAYPIGNYQTAFGSLGISLGMVSLTP